MFKIAKFLAAPLFILGSAFAAEKTLLDSPDSLVHGGFGAPVVKLSRVDGHTRAFVGIEGAWIVNHGFYLGLAGYGMSHGIATDSITPDGARQYAHMGYGGILTGYTFHSDAVAHIAIQQVLGGGGIHLSESRWDEGDSHDRDDDECDARGFFVWEPELRAEINMTRWMRVAVGAGYRLAWLHEEKFGFDGNDLSGPTASLALKFGRF